MNSGCAAALDRLQDFCFMAIKAANREPCTPPRSTLILTPAFVVYTELGIDLLRQKLRETTAHVIATSVLVLNLRKIQCAILQLLTFLRAILSPKQEWAIVQ